MTCLMDRRKSVLSLIMTLFTNTGTDGASSTTPQMKETLVLNELNFLAVERGEVVINRDEQR